MAKSEAQIRTENGLHFLARVTPRVSLCGLESRIFGENGPLPDSLYLLSGDVGTGKTLVLTHWIVKCILPSKFKEKDVGGLGASVLLINTEQHFSLLRLYAGLDKRIKQSLRIKRPRDSNDSPLPFNTQDIESIKDESLSRLQIITCFSAHDLRMLLAGLQALITLKPVSLIIWESLATFYWEDRLLSQRRLATYCCNLAKTLVNAIKGVKICVMLSCQSITWNWEEVAESLKELKASQLLFSKTSHQDFALQLPNRVSVPFKIQDNSPIFMSPHG